MDMTKDIIKKINYMSGSKNVYAVYEDFIHAVAITYANWIEKDKQLEKEFTGIMEQYDIKDMMELWQMLVESAESKMSDLLGDIYMKLEAGNKHMGQFFTPYHVSQMVAKSAFDEEQFKNNEFVTMNEPSCGGGGMIIAYGEIAKEKGYNYQKKIRVEAQDLSQNSFYMCFIQLSMYGFDAKVVLGDTLQLEQRKIWYTPVHYFNGDLGR